MLTVRPEDPVGVVQRLPELFHVREQVPLAVPLEDVADHITALPGRNHCSVRETRDGLGRRLGVPLARKVAVLAVRAIALVRPKTVDGPRVLGKLLAFGLEVLVVSKLDLVETHSVPELGNENEALSRRAAGVVALEGRGVELTRIVLRKNGAGVVVRRPGGDGRGQEGQKSEEGEHDEASLRFGSG